MQQATNSRSIKLKDLKSMAIAIVAILAMPVAVWMTREGPLRANSASELAELARQRTQEEVVSAIQQHVDPFDTTPKQVEQRWIEFREELWQDGVPTEMVEAVVETARLRMKGELWPVLARQGWIKNRPVWVVVASWRHLGGDDGFGAGTEAYTTAQERHEGIDRLTKVVVVDSKAPYELLSG